MALEIVTSGAAVDAKRASRIGLITGIVSDEDFQSAVQERVIELGAARQAVAHAKRLIRLGSEDSLEAAMARESESQEECFETEDFKEGLNAFLEKRRALFEGK
jgi:enoyl-CoA hydratase/carnithine racemase